MYPVRFDGVTKRYPGSDRDALTDLDLTVDAEEFVSLVGPSGCGKSTALRIVAGLERPSSGTVHLGSVDITELETRERHVGLITQQNQLVPHRTAQENIRFPLEVRPPPGPARRDARRRPGWQLERVREEAADFGITDLLDRHPASLSEGQRRLVQLVRAVIASPAILLMDEPFGFLEDHLRRRVRSEVLRIHHERRLTILMATANQQDAMAMSDRIAVLVEGRVVQYETPQAIYDRPATTDVAGFFGEPPMNLLSGIARVDGSERSIDVLGRSVRMWTPVLDRFRDLPIVVGVRPDDVEVGVSQNDGTAVTVERTELLGHTSTVRTRAATGQPVIYTARGAPPRIGTVIDLGFRSDRVHLFDAVTGVELHHPAR